MSTEIDELEKRIASLEKEFRAVFGKCDERKWDPTTPTEPARDLSAEVERLETELRAMTERAENFGRALRSIAEYKGLYIDSEAFYATRKIARVAIANEGEKA